ncbi:activator of (R)-2-hydroxyglutaryl-CoA dehydratase [Gemmatimonas sp.]|uniref:activator of (R)-2-hydroxyglutaryl-CoA dehydratase n=1 Tax=Gemmatimonas sp. TaxID=1962908 RepID=UPI003982F8E6
MTIRMPAPLPLLDDAITATLRDERARLLAEAGLDLPVDHFRRPAEHQFTRAERGQVTVWFGGLTLRHEQLILAGFEGLGYKAGIIPTPAKPDFQAGKEFGNNGQCNPTYFTVGALVNHLRRLRDEQGIPLETILRDHVFLTAGACGPCRFGMYEAEYRLALRNAGFDGFRVLLFQQGGGLEQAAVEAGLELNLNFFITLLNGFLLGDLLNEVAYAIRPYETHAGETDRVLARCVVRCAKAVREKDYDTIHDGALAAMLATVTPVSGAVAAATFLDQLRGTHYTEALHDCRAMLDAIEVDYLRPRPVCKVTGEFWAQTTEGDGNFRMFAFLEGEGAEVLVEPVATWIAYMLNQARTKASDRRALDTSSLRARVSGEVAYRKKLYSLGLAERILTREYDRFREALGGTVHALVNQLELTRIGHPYYNSRAGGGEGHLEVAKNIYYSNKDLCHMVLSLKPFGCMPSTQSDGAQAAVTSHFKDMIYIPIETSGEGDVNAHSRVQMALGEAKGKCKEEFRESVARTGRTLDELRAYVVERPALRRALQRVPQAPGVVGRAANFALHVAGQMVRT